MSLTKLPHDPEGDQQVPPVPCSHSSAWRVGRAGAPQDRKVAPQVLVSGSTTQGLLLGALLWIKVYRNPC